MGMGGWVTGASVDMTRQALRRVLRHIGVAPGLSVQPGVKTRWTQINGPKAYVFAPFDGYFERHFALGDTISAGQLAGWMHELSRPDRAPEPVHFQAAGRLYAHGVSGHVRAGQNLAVLIEDVTTP
jgi:hypothetical protein